MSYNELVKKAAMEPGGLNDPRTGRPINISTTVRCRYRLYYGGKKCRSDEGKVQREVEREDWQTLSNKELNEMIAQDFAASQSGAYHMFLAKSSNISTKKREWIEIRLVKPSRPFNVFFSVIRSDSIDIIAVNTRYKRPQTPRLFKPELSASYK